MATGTHEKIIPITIEQEMSTAYIDYAMSVIVARALPDVRDGLKPVHRRVLYGMHELGNYHHKPFKKSARIVGEVLGKYHPHGDASVYDTMVRLAQNWSLRYPLIQGQGNFGSIDGDASASMRYTEAKLAKITEEMLVDLNKETVDFQANFDDSLQEPTVLPAKLPNLLINGASGIAVGMATNMPSHNIQEVIKGVIAYIDQPTITIDELMQYILAPDFPTGGIIYGYQGIKDAYHTGKGKVVLRAKTSIVEHEKTAKKQIIVHEIPYGVNKAGMIEKTAQLVNDKVIEGIADIRDESDKDGLRIVYDIKRDADPNVVLNHLFKKTNLQNSFNINNIAIDHGKPVMFHLKGMIAAFVDHRHEIVTRRTSFELKQAEKRMHLLEGYIIALDHIEPIIQLIRAAKDAITAQNILIQKYQLSIIQAKAILDMRLQKLTGLEREKIIQEHQSLKQTIEDLQKLLEHKDLRMQVIKEELEGIIEKYNDPRKTAIEYHTEDFTMEDMIPDEEMVITISHQGYIKRTPLTAYKTQARGGVGSKGAATKEDDFTEHLFVASTHDYLLIFTALGKVYWKKVYEVPLNNKNAKGRAIQNLINIHQKDTIKTVIKVKNLNDEIYVNQHYLVMVTQKGIIKKTMLKAYANPRVNGVQAIKIQSNDQLLAVKMTNGNHHILLALASGQAIHFLEKDVRAMGRIAAGVKGITLADTTDRVVGMVSVDPSTSQELLVVSSKGYGKRSSIQDYRITKRGGKGVKTIHITKKTGHLIAIKEVNNYDELMIINKSGITIRMKVDQMRVMGRATQGVRLIKLNDTDAISSVEKIEENQEKIIAL